MGTVQHHTSVRTPVRPSGRAVFVCGVLLLAVAMLAGACAAQATTSGAAGRAAASAIGGAKAAAGGDDWAHTLQVVADLRADPPSTPVVVLLGGSAARESTVSDAGWAAAVKKAGGTAVAAYNLGSRNRTLAQDLELVRAMPHVPTIVFIGINVGRFTSPPSHPTLDFPDPVATLPPYKQHQYSQADILSAAKKQALLYQWVQTRYPAFKANYATSLATLSTLVAACKARGLHPVLFELPRNTQIIGHALDAPVARYTASCRALAKKDGVPWVSFVGPAHLSNTDFYDLWHIVEPGRAVWQPLLARTTAQLLKQYKIGGAGR